MTALLVASFYGHKDVAQHLMTAGAIVDLPNTVG